MLARRYATTSWPDLASGFPHSPKTYIALTGESRVVTQVGAQGRTSRFHYDKPFAPKRPPKDEVVALGA